MCRHRYLVIIPFPCQGRGPPLSWKLLCLQRSHCHFYQGLYPLSTPSFGASWSQIDFYHFSKLDSSCPEGQGRPSWRRSTSARLILLSESFELRSWILCGKVIITYQMIWYEMAGEKKRKKTFYFYGCENPHTRTYWYSFKLTKNSSERKQIPLLLVS